MEATVTLLWGVEITVSFDEVDDWYVSAIGGRDCSQKVGNWVANRINRDTKSEMLLSFEIEDVAANWHPY